MTLRLRTPDRLRRSHADAEDRFQFWVTVGFIAIIALVILFLVAAVGLNYYNAHFKPVATVEGTSITRDDWADRVRLTLYRIQRAEGQVRQAVAAGQIDEQTAQARLDSLNQAAEAVDQQSIEDLIDLLFQEKLAQARGTTLSEVDIDAAIEREASTAELRQVQVIFVEPETDDPNGIPTDEEDAAALEKAEAAEGALADGLPFAQVAQQYSTDISRETGGEYGFITADNTTDEEWVSAVFELDEGATTDIIKGEDGIYRIGRVTRILPGSSDPTFLPGLDSRLSRDIYRNNVRREELGTRLRDAVIEEAVSGEIEQVHLAEIFLEGPEEGTAGSEGEIRASHILYSPNDTVPDPASPLPSDDPAWATAQEAADDATARLIAIADIAEREAAFADIARSESDDTQSGADGGDLGWFGREGMVAEFGDPLFDDPDLERGDIVGPVRSQFGYHVILFVDRRAPIEERLQAVQEALQKPGADFSEAARDFSDGDEAAEGGDLGWLVREQLPEAVRETVFALRPGRTGTPVFAGDGYHVYHMEERGPRVLDARQRPLVRANAFTDWYADEKARAEEEGRISRDPEIFTPDTGDGFDETAP